ncbi:sugar phosphate isomerase/epimerase family protein [Parahaliea aestuarii]|uniref:Sugar phosphate isomerase/epimerase n=1 Tax=Parahaliea aestuarii TaxID=1852021 RepID=A0A5C8ZTD6_9GAMM|nr:sugar phosphate isomerase/epimerase [Parahaliea aestuarii]TXS90551.1 sugar phosphate isomerase/epimerase [Parahaliea aestuarii]
MQRRQFLCGAASAAGLLLASRFALAAERRLNAIGLQLYTVNSAMAADFEGTLREVAAIGYREVEFSTAGGLFRRPPGEVKALLDDVGLRAPYGRLRPEMPVDIARLSREEAMALFRKLGSSDRIVENIEAMLPEAKAMHYEAIVLSAVLPDEMADMAGLERMAGIFNAAGRLCAEHGMRFAYHNHDFDFRPVNGVLPYEYLLQHTDPAAVSFQLDLYWASKAGQDPVRLLRDYGARINSCHMKDLAEDGGFADVGAGTLDFPALTRAAVDAGVGHFFVEHDRPEHPIDSARNSYRYLSAMTF